jgi:N-acetylglucosamine kinase-like BadF-type ATPase
MPAMRRDPLVRLPDALTRPQRRPDARYVMGVDGGATKTLAAVLDLQAKTLHVAHGGPSNEDAVGTAAAVDCLLETAEEAISLAAIAREDLAAAVLAIAGTNTDAIAAAVRAARRADWIVVNDVVAAWATATGAGPGLATISGTGSNVFGVGSEGRAWRAGGWGHLLGDEGSAYWFGLQSIKAALRDREASGPETALSDAAPIFFGAPSVEALANLVYSKPLTKGEIAAFAIETARLADAGDEVALALFEQGARMLSEQIAAVIRMVGLADETSGRAPFPLGLIGSTFRAGPMFVDPLTRAVHEHAPQAQVVVVKMAPVGGSLLLAARVCGHDDELAPAELSQLIDEALTAPRGR